MISPSTPPADRRAHDASSRRIVAARLAALLAGLALLLAGCGSSGTTFDPRSTCGPDGKFAGAYPDLEHLLPAAFEAKSAGTIDSGRSCSAANLGSLVTHAAAGIEFAGATWDEGGGTAITSAVFRLPGRDLPAAWIAEFYEIGARTAKYTANIETSRPVFPGTGLAWRLDALNNLSLQTIVTWQDASVVRVVLVATEVAPDASRQAHDDLVAAAIAATVPMMGRS